ncbi:MAG: YhcH/YjgK/YiaL family protein [Prevotella sp.]
MRKLFFILTMALFAVVASGQGVYTKPVSKAAEKAAAKWVKKGEWRNGFVAAKPHESVNVVEFQSQYAKNKAQWDAMFQWLANTDLLSIPKGKHPIEGTGLVVSVEDSENEELAKRGSESHYHHIDFQYVVKGSERFGIIEHETSKPNCKYKPDVMHYDYDESLTRFYDSSPDKFFLFFPDDWHIAKVKTDKQDQTIRVIVVKLDYVE